MATGRESYILEVSWGCPSDRYPLNGLFQFDQAKALSRTGQETIFLALDMRSVRKWRKWGVHRFTREKIRVVEYNFPYGPFSPLIKYGIQKHGFKRCMEIICRENGFPSCVHFHGVMEAVSGMECCMDLGIPYIITEHITPVNEGEKVHKMMTDAYRNASKVICVSNKLASDIMDSYGAHTDAVIPNIVDLSRFEYNSGESEGKCGSFRFLSAASLNAGKGFDVLIRAYAGLLEETKSGECDKCYGNEEAPQSIHLTVMGDGPEMRSLVNLAESLGISEHVDFTGSYIRGEFADELARSDCFVLSSRSETFGIVYIEAMAAGVPVIATRCGGPEDFVDDTNGLLVAVDDVSAIKDAMLSMLSDPHRYDRARISGECRKRFSPETVAASILQVVGDMNDTDS